MRRKAPRRLPARRNPMGFKATDLALMAGLAWFVMSDRGRLLLGSIFPEAATPGGTGGVGDASGRNPSDPSQVLVPRQPRFRITGVQNFPTLIRIGSRVDVTMSLNHLGPSGLYVAGLELTSYNPGCVIGLHGTSFFNAESDIVVEADGTSSDYTVPISFTYPYTGPGAVQFRAYIRDTRGTQLADIWSCPATVVI